MFPMPRPSCVPARCANCGAAFADYARRAEPECLHCRLLRECFNEVCRLAVVIGSRDNYANTEPERAWAAADRAVEYFGGLSDGCGTYWNYRWNREGRRPETVPLALWRASSHLRRWLHPYQLEFWGWHEDTFLVQIIAIAHGLHRLRKDRRSAAEQTADARSPVRDALARSRSIRLTALRVAAQVARTTTSTPPIANPYPSPAPELRLPSGFGVVDLEPPPTPERVHAAETPDWPWLR